MKQCQKEIQALLLKDKEPSFDEIMLCIEQIRKDGNTFIIKLDGMRSIYAKQYTVVIGFPSNPAQDVIRADTSTLKEAFLSVLKRYFHAYKSRASCASRSVSGGLMDQSKEAIEVLLSKNQELSFDGVMLCAEQIRRDGNIFFIGLDTIGTLDKEQYIVEVGFPSNIKKNDIKASSSTIKAACLSVLKQYFHAHNI